MVLLGLPRKKPVVVKKKMKGLYWQKIKNQDIPGTVWTAVDQELELSPQGKSALEECFNADKMTTEVTATRKAPANPLAMVSDVKTSVSLYDGKRTQNVLIFLGRVKYTPAQLVDFVIAVRTLLCCIN